MQVNSTTWPRCRHVCSQALTWLFQVFLGLLCFMLKLGFHLFLIMVLIQAAGPFFQNDPRAILVLIAIYCFAGPDPRRIVH